MYSLFATDLVRVDQERLRLRTECALHRTEAAASVANEPGRRNRTFRRRPAAIC